MKLNLKERIKNVGFWIVVSIIITLTLGIITRITDSDGFYTATIISIIPLALLIVVSFVFTWIINPIRLAIQKIKDRRA